MGAVLEHAFTDKGIPALGIWAQVPHYVSAMSYPAATAGAARPACTRSPDSSSMRHAIRQETIIQRQRLDQLVAGNDEHRAMVSPARGALRHAKRADTICSAPAGIPTGDELAAEFERFLRDQDT